MSPPQACRAALHSIIGRSVRLRRSLTRAAVIGLLMAYLVGSGGPACRTNWSYRRLLTRQLRSRGVQVRVGAVVAAVAAWAWRGRARSSLPGPRAAFPSDTASAALVT